MNRYNMYLISLIIDNIIMIIPDNMIDNDIDDEIALYIINSFQDIEIYIEEIGNNRVSQLYNQIYDKIYQLNGTFENIHEFKTNMIILQIAISVL